MRAFSRRFILALAVAVALSVILFIYLSKSPYISALGLVLGAFLAQLSTFRAGVVFGTLTALPFSLYLTLSGVMPGTTISVSSILLNVLLLIGFGAIYCGVVVWLINNLKRGRIFFS